MRWPRCLLLLYAPQAYTKGKTSEAMYKLMDLQVSITERPPQNNVAQVHIHVQCSPDTRGAVGMGLYLTKRILRPRA